MFCKNCGQNLKESSQFCTNCGISVISKGQSSFLKKNKAMLIVVLIGLFILIVTLSIAAIDGGSVSQPNYYAGAAVSQENSAFQATTTVSQSSIISSVVNIWCYDSSIDNVVGGSGTLWTSDGLIITNSHIIPQDKNGNPQDKSCMVTLPNLQGGIKDIYVGDPIVIPGLSNEYDIAFIQISGPYTDDYGVYHGPYPTKFPDYPDLGCKNNNVVLGEPVTVFGYPEISDNGNSLTITNGIVSSLPGDGTIVTSAKVAHGDSGGLAVDEDGCMIGIPSMVSSDDSESLGIIKSNSTIGSFLSDVTTALDKSMNSESSTLEH
jgi:hypothetical protein